MLRCGRKGGRKCGFEIHTRSAVSPRQHWGSGCAPSPTTRPPRTYVCVVLVVGLGSWCFWMLAGAGFAGRWFELDGLSYGFGVVSGIGGGVLRWGV
jgi:hypothetical protein